MPGPFKVTLKANVNIQGFSESYYCAAASPEEAFTKALALANLRQQMMADPARIKYIKVADDTLRRVSTLTAVGQDTGVPITLGSYFTDADIPNTCAFATYYSTTERVQRTASLSGIPDDVYNPVVPGNPDATRWRSFFDGPFKNFITMGDWFIKSRRVISSPPAPTIIEGWTNVPGTLNSNITLKSAIPGLVQGDYLVIVASGSVTPAPGIVKVLLVGATNLVVQVKFSLPEDYVFESGPLAFKFVPRYAPINKLNFVKIGSHKRGRPFGSSAGRATARAR